MTTRQAIAKERLKDFGYHIKNSFTVAKTQDTSKKECVERIARSYGVPKSHVEIWYE